MFYFPDPPCLGACEPAAVLHASPTLRPCFRQPPFDAPLDPAYRSYLHWYYLGIALVLPRYCLWFTRWLHKVNIEYGLVCIAHNKKLAEIIPPVFLSFFFYLLSVGLFLG